MSPELSQCATCEGRGNNLYYTIALVASLFVALMLLSQASGIIKRRLLVCLQRRSERQNAEEEQLGGAEEEQDKRRYAGWRALAAVLAMFKALSVQLLIVVSFAQVVSSVTVNFNLPFDDFFRQICEAFSFINLDLFVFIDVTCSGVSQNYYSKLVFTTLAPLVIIVLLLLGAALSSRILSGQRLQQRRGAFYSWVLLLLFIIYPSVCQTIFRVWDCEEFPTIDARNLRTDYSITCGTMTEDDPEYAFYAVYATIMFILYPVGVPLIYFLLLLPYRKQFAKAQALVSAKDGEKKARQLLNRLKSERQLKADNEGTPTPKEETKEGRVSGWVGMDMTRVKALVQQKKKEEEQAELQAEVDMGLPVNLRFLYDRYEFRFWWFESVEMMYKFLVTAFVARLGGRNGQTTPAQVGFCCLVTFFSIFLLQETHPFKKDSSDRLMVLSRWSAAIMYFNALITFVQDESNVGFSLLTNIMIFLVPGVVFVHMILAYLVVPIKGMREVRPDLSIASCRFWNIFCCKGGYGYHMPAGKPAGLRAVDLLLKETITKTAAPGADKNNTNKYSHKRSAKVTPGTSFAESTLPSTQASQPSSMTANNC